METATFRREGVLVVGETLVDLLPDGAGPVRRHVGGSAANVALGLARLGRPVRLWTCLGDDADGRWLAARLGSEGVELVGDPWVLERTSRAAAVLDGDGVATWEFDVAWTPAGAVDTAAAAVHTGSLAAVLEPGAGTVRSVLDTLGPGTLRSFDVNARAPLSTAAAVQTWLDWPDLVRASREDLTLLWPGVDGQALARSWLRRHRRLGTVALTDGAAGAVRLSRHSADRVPAPGVQVVDTVGAGDAFTAATVDGWLRGRGDIEDWTAVVERAVRAASLSVTRPGAAPPTLAELDGAPVH